ncbi:salicylate hydroxylase [Alteribacillus persepolensis]|uniref:Salicylate hydroxylase n=1 Tax=Alteribacillus persepolensis TaxID=568899 RepID=A0A1G8DSF3_9BACI|nr:FAD-dependent monooxygenase [Alteribacillus persepolensis]SDH60582.1 salicylate hydroxylase [Alteribacillus persepolensis]
MRLKEKKISKLKVVIIGGGIGGAATAVALKNQGIHADLYEQAPVIKEVGAGIGMRPPTVKFFKDWGIYNEIERKSEKSSFMQILTSTGEVLINEEWPLLTNNPEDRWARLIHRADLIDIFFNQLPSESIHLNHKCDSIIDYGDHAEIHFDNGNSVVADLVIAADGIRSTVRSKLFSNVEPVYSHTHAYRAVVEEKETFNLAPDNTFKVFVDGETGNHVYFMPLHHRKQVSFDVTVSSADASWRPEVEKKDILQCLENFDSKIQKIAEKIDNYTCRSIYDIDPLERWHSDCITLLGDAAHAMLHHQGQGANSAIQDGGVLAESIRDAATIPEALQIYQARRKPITDKYQELSRRPPKVEAKTAFPEKSVFETP